MFNREDTQNSSQVSNDEQEDGSKSASSLFEETNLSSSTSTNPSTDGSNVSSSTEERGEGGHGNGGDRKYYSHHHSRSGERGDGGAGNGGLGDGSTRSPEPVNIKDFWAKKRQELQCAHDEQQKLYEATSWKNVFDKETIFSSEDLEKFLSFKCSYKRHKGEQWSTILAEDPQYFVWVMINRLPTHTKTWSVFANLLTPEQRAAAIQRTKENQTFIEKRPSKRPRSNPSTELPPDAPSKTGVLAQPIVEE